MRVTAPCTSPTSRPPLTANNFFNNRNGLGNPTTHFNQYGLTAGGPVLIPKVFNGKNKLFWFFSLGERRQQPAQQRVP